MRINAIAFLGALAMATTLLVAGCDKEVCEPASQVAGSPDQSADLRQAAEDSVRFSAKNPNSVRFRGIQVWPQAVKNQFAVCGQANVFGSSSNTYVLFVVVVTRDDVGLDPSHGLKVDARVGNTVTEATKVYIDTLARCYESGGPQNIMRGTRAAPVPPMPSDMKTVLQVPHPLRRPRPSLPHRRPSRSLRQRPRLRPSPPLHPAPLSCARTATFGSHRRAKPYASNLRARS